MLNIEFEKDLGKNYMVLPGKGFSSDYSIRMVKECCVDRLLPIEVSNVDGNARYHYEIEGYQQLEKRYAMASMEYEDIEKIIRAIASLPRRLEEYLLDKDNIYLSPSTIFLNSEGEPYFVYYPDENVDYSQGVREICTFILRKLNHQSEKAVSAGYAAFEISARESFALSDFERQFKPLEPEPGDLPTNEDNALLSLSEDFDELDLTGLDLFEEEDFEEEEEDDSLPPYDEEIDKKAVLIEKLLKYGPFVLIIIAGAFLFLSSSMASLSLPLRILSFAMISLGIMLISYLLKGRFVSIEK